MSEFVDANIFVRYLTGDDLQKAKRCRMLFLQAQRGEAQLVTSESVIAEVAYVLGSPARYQMSREVVAKAMQGLVSLPGLHVDHKESILRAFDVWGSSRLDFEDCLSTEHVRRADLAGIYSYDRDFDRIAGINRLEP